ncbi:uncharacterized protein [Branchiostoma lanceolatum]|uniref:uncharacterized protein n=1 Tax=Branchiostoma lanceolatum TaxID=7740 RepID=UPI0034520401
MVGLDTSTSSSTSNNPAKKSSTQPEKRKAEEEGGGVEKKGKTDSKQSKTGKDGYLKKQRKKTTRLENAFAGLEKSIGSLQEGQEDRQREADKQRADEWKEHDLRMLQMQQDHETRTVTNMMGQFMAMMGQFMANQQGSTQSPPTSWGSSMPHSTAPSGSLYTGTYGGQSGAPPMSYNPAPYPPTAGGQSWSSSMPSSAVPTGNQYQSQGPSMSYPSPTVPHSSPPVSEDPSTSDKPTYTQLY